MVGLLSRTLHALNREQIAYCLLRDGADVAAGAQPAEIDLLVQGNQMTRLSAQLAKLGFVRLPAWGHQPHQFFLAYDALGDRWLKLDVVTLIAYGRPAHSLHTNLGQRCLEHRKVEGDALVPAPEDELMTLLLHCLLDKHDVSADRGRRLGSLVRGPLNDAYLARLLARFLPRTNVAELRAAIEREDWPWLLALRRPARRTLLRRQPLAALWRTARDHALRRIHRAARLVRPTTLSVAVVAPDGAGKSTVISAVEKSFGVTAKSIHMGLYRTGQRRTLLAHVPLVGLLSNVATQWRRWMKARLLQARGCLVLFDRYTYDALLPTPSPLSAAKRWRRALLARSCPGPDLVVMLDAPGDVLFARKGEHTIAHLERQRQGYLSLRGSLPHMVVIDATSSAESVCRQVTTVIWQRLVDRLNWRRSA